METSPVLLAIPLLGSSFRRKLFVGKGGNTCADEDFSTRETHLKAHQSPTLSTLVNKSVSCSILNVFRKNIPFTHTYICTYVRMQVLTPICTSVYRHTKIYTGINKYKPCIRALHETKPHKSQGTLSSGEYYNDYSSQTILKLLGIYPPPRRQNIKTSAINIVFS